MVAKHALSRPADAAVTTTTMATLKRLLQLSPDAMLVVDQDGIIVLFNPQASVLFGYSPDHLVGHPLEHLLPQRLRARHEDHLQEYLAAPHMRPMGVGLDLVGRRQDGSEFSTDISLRPFRISRQLYVTAAIRDVSAQRQWERERADLLGRLRLQADLINLAHDAILVRDSANRVLVWNKGAEELYGWTAQEALGHVTNVLFKTRFPVSPHTLQAQLDRDGTWEGELVHTRPDGRTVIVESKQVVVRDAAGQSSAILEINRDITERRRLEESEASAQASTQVQLSFLQQMMDALPNGVYVVHGLDARLVLANRAAASTWGAVWEPEQPMREFMDTHHIVLNDAQGRAMPPDTWATMRALQQGETSLQFQETIRRPQGNDLPLLVNAVPLAFSYWHSLQRRRPLAEESADTGHESHYGRIGDQGGNESGPGEPLALVIQQDVRGLKEAEYVKDEFIGLAAHELRSPVAALKGAVETLLLHSARGSGVQLAEWQQEMLQEIDLATNRLTGLTDDLLDATRLQVGHLLLHLAPTDVNALVRRVVNRIQLTTPLHQLDVKIAQPGRSERKKSKEPRTQSLQIIANIDSTRIEQVLINLLVNAIKYSPGGGPICVTLDPRDRRSGQPEAHGERRVHIEITDRGIGIPAHQHPLIFGRFMRGDNARQAGISGTGLGLYLCRGIVEQHGGQIWFESQEGKGTTFFLTLPLLDMP